ncbi:hypothetical protein SAM_0669 [Streptococcus agalactiae CJB111]|nr:hypothetical protein SAL_0712 [Streptococcus agalactiae 515]EAO73625.1 hypothetical protein SAM_0669 [Streptococcus agalactiae CJB111]EAO76713.1 hypothetical protein SAN_0706 [Streptococcus agalactiae COH1]EAO78059.1 hypothetical protein SAI_0710 [Streptococcus agalactiae H36B]
MKIHIVDEKQLEVLELLAIFEFQNGKHLGYS